MEIKGLFMMNKPLPQVISPISSIQDIHKCMKYFSDKHEYRNHAIFVCGIAFGLKAGDLLNLKIKDVFNSNNTLKKYLILVNKTDKRNRILITDLAKESLELLFRNLDNFNMNDYLFKSQKGVNQHLAVRSLHKILKKMGRQENLNYEIGTNTLKKTHDYFMSILEIANTNSQSCDLNELVNNIKNIYQNKTSDL